MQPQLHVVHGKLRARRPEVLFHFPAGLYFYVCEASTFGWIKKANVLFKIIAGNKEIAAAGEPEPKGGC